MFSDIDLIVSMQKNPGIFLKDIRQYAFSVG